MHELLMQRLMPRRSSGTLKLIKRPKRRHLPCERTPSSGSLGCILAALAIWRFSCSYRRLPDQSCLTPIESGVGSLAHGPIDEA